MLKLTKIVLLVIIVLLSYILLTEMNKPVTLPVVTDTTAKNTTNKDVTLVEQQFSTLPEISEYDEIINRPLFFEERKPYVYVPPEKPVKKTTKKKKTTQKKIEEYALNAVIITPEKQLAIIQSGRGKKIDRVALGESIDDWVVETIEPRSVSLKKGSETKTLELEIKASDKNKKAKKENTKVSNKKEQTGKTTEKPNIKLKTPGA